MRCGTGRRTGSSPVGLRKEGANAWYSVARRARNVKERNAGGRGTSHAMTRGKREVSSDDQGFSEGGGDSEKLRKKYAGSIQKAMWVRGSRMGEGGRKHGGAGNNCIRQGGRENKEE